MFRSLVSRGCGCFSRALLLRLCRRCAFGLAVPLGLWLVLGLRLRCCVCPTGCGCCGCAAGTLLDWLCPLGFGWCSAFVYVGAFVQPGAAAAALPPVRFWIGCALWLSAWRLARSLAWARLSCRVQLRRLCRRYAFGLAVPLGLGWMHGRVDVLRIRRTSPLFFPLQTIAPSQRGLPAPAGWGRDGVRTYPSGFADAWPAGKLRICLRCAA